MKVVKYVVEDQNGNLVVIGCKGFQPNNVIGVVSESIDKADYPYLVKTPIYDTESPELIVGYDISVDQAAKDEQNPINGQESGV